MSDKEKHLYYMSELKDYKINSKDPDIRGWMVKDLDNRVVGKVDNLLVNKELGKVVYIDVEVDQSIIDSNHDPYAPREDKEVKEFINKDGENHIIIPIGLVSLNRDKKYIFTESINYQTFAETKRYKSGSHISRDYEHNVLGSYNRNRDRENHQSDHEIRRTASAYSDEEIEEREYRKREEAERRDHAGREHSDDLDERMRREKENLKYKSERQQRERENRSSGIDNYSYNSEMQPEPTLDDDLDWERDKHRLEDKDPYKNRKRKRTRDSQFYDRREFDDRDYL